MKALAALVALLLLLPSPGVLAETPKAGLWEVISTVVQNGKTQVHKRRQCLTPAMVADPEAAFGEAPLPLIDCARVSSWDGTVLRFTLQCAGLGGNGTVRFPTATQGDGRIAMKGAFAGQPLDFSVKMTGTWIGACPQ